MEKFLNKKTLLNTFSYISNVINGNSSMNNKNPVVLYKPCENFKYDSMLFFKAGQLLFLLYIFNINNLKRKEISYNDCTFYILDLFNKEFFIDDLTSFDCESIAYNFIKNSVYRINFLPIKVTTVNDDRLLELKNGFTFSYNVLLNEKITILNTLENSDNKLIFTNLIRNLKLLNPNDLNKQLKIITIRYKNKYIQEDFQKLSCDALLSYDEFIRLQSNFTPNLIQNAIIGVNDNDFSLTWVGFIDNTLIPLGYRNIYIALFLGYLSVVLNNTHYFQCCIQAINTSIKNFDINKNNLLQSNKKAELSKILKSFHLLSQLISYEKLTAFILDNKNLIDYFKIKSININIKTDNFINNYLKPLIFPILKSLLLIKIK